MKQRVIWILLVLTPILLAAALLAGAAGPGWDGWGTPLGRALFNLRAGRIAAGFMVGASLASAGVILQALLRNPLADPYVLGISGGAALGAALAILAGLAGSLQLPAVAFLGGLATLAVVYGLAGRSAAPSLYALLLSGVIVSAVCSSLLMLIISLAPVKGLHGITWWMLGNLQVLSWPLLAGCALLMVLAFAILWQRARDWNALTLGADMAWHLGIRTRRAILLGLGLATLLTAAAVALAGLIGFVGLIVPHAMRSLVGTDHRRLLPAAALGGGLFLVLCDALGRLLAQGGEIPAGVITALIGGPFFLILLRRRPSGGWLE